MSVVIDSSAMLAVIFEEPGSDVVLQSCRGAIISAVNMDEVLHKSERRGIAPADIEAQLGRLHITVVSFDTEQARITARLHPNLHRLGISFADRACLALAEVTRRAVLSADTDWAKIELSVDIRLIR